MARYQPALDTEGDPAAAPGTTPDALPADTLPGDPAPTPDSIPGDGAPTPADDPSKTAPAETPIPFDQQMPGADRPAGSAGNAGGIPDQNLDLLAPLDGDTTSPMDPVPMGQTGPMGAGPMGETEDGYLGMPMPGERPARTCSSGTWLNRGCWYAQSDAVYMNRQSFRKQFVLADDLSTPLSRRSFLVIDRNQGFAPGARLTLGKYVGRDSKNRDHAVEFTFFGLNDWSTDRGIVARGNGGIFTELDPLLSAPGFVGSDSQRYFYRSSFNSYEANLKIMRRLGRDRMTLTREGNWVRTCAPGPLSSFIAGLRVITTNERFGYFGQGTSFFGTVRQGSYLVSTNNSLVGPQMGADIVFQNCNWRAGIRGKTGAFLNFADQQSVVVQTGPNSPADRNETASRTPLSFVGELNATAAYNFRPNMAVRVSGELLWINQVALAPQQVTFIVANPPNIATGGNLFFQSISAGLEFVW